MKLPLPKLEALPRAIAFFLFTVFLSLATASVNAQPLEGDVVGGRMNPVPIAITPFLTGGGTEEEAGVLRDVISNNLGRSGYFNPLPPESFIEQISEFNQQPRFVDWQQAQAKALVVGQVFADGNRLKVQFRLFDVNSQEELAAEEFTTTKKNLRRIGHRISDIIYSKITGIEGYFDTRVVFIDESGPKDRRIKKLAIMDQDGYNVRTLTDGEDIVVTPRFSPNSQEITFMAIGGGTPRVYLYNIETRQREIVGEFPNMSFAPRFSPDGQRVIMSLLTPDGRNSNIFEMDLGSRDLRQLTNTPAINTGPSYSPDGSQITFESDRGGTQQIYVMNSDGSGQNRISFGEGRYSTPVWSPDGKNIAFTKQASGRFAIGVMLPDGSGERILTEGFHNEGPTWAPNGRVLMFFREGQGESGGPQLFSVDITGYNEQQVPTPGFSSDPAWSPRLK